MTLSDWTKLLILSTAALWIAYDIFAYNKQGNLPTESWQLKRWAYLFPGFCVLVGILIGHIFFTFTAPETLPVPCVISK